MKHSFFALSFFLFAFVLPVGADTSVFKILPRPQQVEWGSTPAIKQGTTLDKLRVQTIITKKGVPRSEQGYVLSVRASGITVKARTQVGVQYGLTTLQQLLDDARDFSTDVPEVTVTDWPAEDYRAVHIDVKNHLDSLSYYYRLIDRLAYYKINGIIWEVEDKLQYERRPEIAVQGAIPIAEMRKLSEYAHARNIDISPLVQGIGHASFILKWHPELREDPASDWDMCPLNDSTYALQFDLYRDALSAMPYAKYLHVGGDETHGLGVCPRCKASGKNSFELQMVWLDRVCRFASDAGRRPVFWDDMPLKHADVFRLTYDPQFDGAAVDSLWNEKALNAELKLFPKNCIFMRWRYEESDLPGNLRLLDWYDKNHISVIAATAASVGTQGLPRHHARMGWIQRFNQIIAPHHFMGMLATAWDDGSPNIETVVKGFVAQAEFGWNPEGRSIAEFDEAHAQREYGFAAGTHRMAFLDSLESAFNFFDQALVVSGHRTPAYSNKNFKLIDLPDASHAGAWTKKYAAKLTRAQQLSDSYGALLSAILANRRDALRNSYAFDVYRVLARQQNFPVRLLLALGAYDRRPSAQSWQKVLDVCDEFAAFRQDFETTYSRTRIMTPPEGYRLDMNKTGMLARLTANDDWMFLYELAMIKKIREHKPSF